MDIILLYKDEMSNAKNVTRPFISKAEVGRRRGISRVGVYRLIWAGLIPVDAQGRIERAAFEYLQAKLAQEMEGTKSPASNVAPEVGTITPNQSGPNNESPHKH